MQPDGEDVRRAAYGADVTYVTSKELGFDYLRDRLVLQGRRTPSNLALDRLLEGTAAKLRCNGRPDTSQQLSPVPWRGRLVGPYRLAPQ
jgi:hypothetical protein